MARAGSARVGRDRRARCCPIEGWTASVPGIAGCRWRGSRRVGERGPLGGRLRDDDWLRGFGGGLVATCGLRNVGAPSEGHGLHGEISHQPARDVRVARWVDGEQVVVSASGAVAEVSALGHRLELERTWTTRTGEGRLELVDVTRNLGPEPEPAPLLYHVNLGAPLWSAGATLALDARATTPRDERRRRAVGPRARTACGRARARLRARGRRRGGRVVRGDRRLAGHRAAAASCAGRRRACRAFTSGSIPRRGSRCSASSPRTARSSAAPPTARRGACPCSSRASSASRASRSGLRAARRPGRRRARRARGGCARRPSRRPTSGGPARCGAR